MVPVPPPVVATTTTTTIEAVATSATTTTTSSSVLSAASIQPPKPSCKNLNRGGGSGGGSTQKPPVSKSLASLLKYMEGIEIIVELKTGHRHRGILVSADEFMNLTLEKSSDSSRESSGGRTARLPPSETTATASSSTTAALSLATTPAVPTEDLLDIYSCMDIRGPTIRYIQFPDNANLTTLVKSGVERERAAAKKYNRGKRK